MAKENVYRDTHSGDVKEGRCVCPPPPFPLADARETSGQERQKARPVGNSDAREAGCPLSERGTRKSGLDYTTKAAQQREMNKRGPRTATGVHR